MIDDWIALCVTIARNWRLKEKEKAKTDRKYCEGLCEEPDGRTGLEEGGELRDVVDARRMLTELEQQFEAGEMPDKADQILDCVQAGMKNPAIAAELGLTAECVRMRLRRVRELFERGSQGSASPGCSSSSWCSRRARRWRRTRWSRRGRFTRSRCRLRERRRPHRRTRRSARDSQGGDRDARDPDRDSCGTARAAS